MRRSIINLSAAGAVAAFAAAFALASAPVPAGAQEVTIHKDPYCGCCEAHAQYLRENGFTVTVKASDDVQALGRAHGIPEEAQGCHLAVIGNYVVSGHVPVGTIEKLLSERPDIKGLTLPGMPTGSPGMGGEKEGPFEVLAVSKSGGIEGVYDRE